MGARDLLADLAGAGMSVTAEGDRLVIRPASKLTDEMRGALRKAKPALLALLRSPPSLRGVCAPSASPWTDAAIATFLARRARLIRWGWSEPDAERMAERLGVRDREQNDDRVTCIDCRHYRPGRCGNHRAAGLTCADLGRDLAGLLQRCPGFRGEAEMPRTLVGEACRPPSRL